MSPRGIAIAALVAVATAAWSAARAGAADEGGAPSVGRIELLRPRIERLHPVVRADGLDVELTVAEAQGDDETDLRPRP